MSAWQGTPGPWRVRINPTALSIIPAGTLPTVATISLGYNPARRRDIKDADAKGIAAVPELVEALAQAREVLRNIPAPHSHPLWIRMCGAIRDAEAALKAAGVKL